VPRKNALGGAPLKSQVRGKKKSRRGAVDVGAVSDQRGRGPKNPRRKEKRKASERLRQLWNSRGRQGYIIQSGKMGESKEEKEGRDGAKKRNRWGEENRRAGKKVTLNPGRTVVGGSTPRVCEKSCRHQGRTGRLSTGNKNRP